MTERLISADALYTLFVKMKSFGELTAKKAIRCVEEAPTVEAIHVEWINKYTNEHRTYMHAFSEMVACWYGEKENRDYERASDMRDYCERYESAYNSEDGSL